MLRSESYSKVLVRVFFVAGVLFTLFGCASMGSIAQQNVGAKAIKPSNNQSELLLENTEHSMLSRSSVANTLLSPVLLRADLTQLVERVNEVHPEPFEATGERMFNQKVEVIRQSLRFPISRREFYLRVAPLVTELRDIHSRISLPRNFQESLSFQSEKAGTHRNKLFPLAVLYEATGLLVAADLTKEPTIPVGATLVSINGAPIDYLLSVMKKLTSYETEAGLRRKIQVSFPWLLTAMGYGSNTYEISYEWQGLPVSQRVGGITIADKTKGVTETKEPKKQIWQATTQQSNAQELEDNKESTPLSALSSKPSNTRHSFYGFNQLSSHTALLWFNDFNEQPQIFSAFLKQHFKQFEANGLSNLIIDLRYNEGGLTQNIRSLLSFLIHEPIYWNQIGQIKISEPLKVLHRERTRQRRKSKYHWGLQWLPLEWTDFLQYEISWGEIGKIVNVEFEPVEPSHLGLPENLTVLTNGYCFSACSVFVAVINKENLGTTMGETPGNFVRVQYGYPMSVKLKHSQLELTLPTMKLLFEKDRRDRKNSMMLNTSLISPQIEQSRSQYDIENRVDSLLNSALLGVEN